MPALCPTVRQDPSSRRSLHSGTKTVGLGPPPPVGLKRSFWHCNLASARALGTGRLCFRAVGKVSVYQPPRGGSIGGGGGGSLDGTSSPTILAAPNVAEGQIDPRLDVYNLNAFG